MAKAHPEDGRAPPGPPRLGGGIWPALTKSQEQMGGGEPRLPPRLRRELRLGPGTRWIQDFDSSMSVLACFSAFLDSVLLLASGLSCLMALPRLSPVVILPLRSSKGIPRLFETWTAATKSPRFLKPLAASVRLVPEGSMGPSRDWRLAARWAFEESSLVELLCETDSPPRFAPSMGPLPRVLPRSVLLRPAGPLMPAPPPSPMPGPPP